MRAAEKMPSGSADVKLQQEANDGSTGPASFVAVDPDGTPVLVDQHV